MLLAECDVLYDEGARYAERLREAGVPVKVRVYEGMLHGFLALAGKVDAAWDGFREIGEAVGTALAAEPAQAEAAAAE